MRGKGEEKEGEREKEREIGEWASELKYCRTPLSDEGICNYFKVQQQQK